MKFTVSFKSSLFFVWLWIFPVLFLLHGIVYNYLGLELVAGKIVYAQKLVIILPCIVGIIQYGISPFAYFYRQHNILAFFVCLAFAGGVFANNSLSIFTKDAFYFLSDFLGFIFLWCAASQVYWTLIKGKLHLFDLLMTIYYSSALISVGNIFVFFLTNGDKVSIPPEIHFGYSLMLIVLLLKSKKISRSNYFFWFSLIPLILNSVTSQMRIYIILMTLTAVIYIVVSLISTFKQIKNFKVSRFDIFSIVSLCILSTLVVYIFYDSFESRLSTMVQFDFNVALNNSNFSSNNDQSISQRFHEARLVINEMLERSSIVNLLVGKGFGSTYLNTIFPLKDQFLRTIHNNYLSIWFRTGISGLVAILWPTILSLSMIRFSDLKSTSGIIFLIISTSSLYLLIALAVDNYLFWNLSTAAIWGASLYALSLSRSAKYIQAYEN